MCGPKVAELERKVASIFRKEFGLMTKSGSSANLLGVLGLDLKKGTKVITPSLTFSTTVAPLVQAGLVPYFVDVDVQTLQMDPKHLKNLDLTKEICCLLADKRPRGRPYSGLITFVEDRPGHDRRYAIDSSKIANELDWQAKTSLKDGIRKTVDWHLDNQDWVTAIASKQALGSRLGLG